MKLLPLRLPPPLLTPLARATAVLFWLLFLCGAARTEAADTPASWTSAVSGNWTTATDWSTNPNAPNNGVGGVNYAVTIGATGSPYTITVNTGITVDTLALSSANATLSLTNSGVLTVLGTDTLTAGTLQLSGGTLSGGGTGTLNFAGGSLVIGSNSQNIISGLTINGDITLNASSAETQIANGTTFNTAHLATQGTGLGFATGQTFNNTISFEGVVGGSRNVEMNGSNGTLTIGSAGVIKTVAGFAGGGVIGGANDYGGQMALTNQGLILSQVSGVGITIQANTFTNAAAGIVQASNGGIVSINSPTWNNAGNIKSLTGSTVNLAGNWSNTGTVTVDATSKLFLGGTFATSGLGTLALSAGSAVSVNGAWTNTGQTFTLNSSTGSWTLAGGSLTGGTLNVISGTSLLFGSNAQNLLSGVTINGDITLNSNTAETQIAGNTTFTTAHLATQGTGLGFAPGQTFNNTISFEGAAGGSRNVELNGTAGTFTIGGSGVIKTVAGFGGGGVIGGASNFGGNMALTNQGLILSQVSGQSISVQANTFTNAAAGVVQATGGGIVSINSLTWNNAGNLQSLTGSTLNLAGNWSNTGTITVDATSKLFLGGTFATSGLGTLALSAGSAVTVNGAWTNTGQTFTLNGSTGSWTIAGGTLTGGTLNVLSGTNLLFNSSGQNVLSGVTINGDITLSSNTAETQITGNTTFTTAHLATQGTGLGFAPGQTFNNTISFEGVAGGSRNVDLNGTAGTFTIGSSGLIQTTAGLGGNGTIGSGNNYGGQMALTNLGKILSQVSGQTITILSNTFTNGATGVLQATGGGILTITPPVANPWTNTGTIAVSTGGIVNLGGTFDATGAGGIGTFNNTGGTVNVTGLLNNAGKTLTLNASTGSWTINGGTLSGGTVAFANGATLLLASASTNLLTGVTVNGDLTLSASGARTQIAGGTIFAVAHLANTSAGLGFAPGQTLTGTISFEGASSAGRYVDMNGTAGTLTIGSTGVLSTAAGFAGSAVIGGQNLYNGAMSLVNTGLISSQTSGQSISIQSNSFANSTGGTLQASNGGILTITPANPWTNTGTIAVSTGGIVNLGGTFDATGVGGIGTFNNTGGTVNITGTLNNAGRTLTLNSSTGSWTMNGGTLSGGTLAFANGATLMLASASANLLTGVTVNGDLTLSASGARTQIGGGTTFATAHLANTSAGLGFAPGQTLTGTISFEGASVSGRYVDMNGTAGTLTIGSTGVLSTAAGFAGTTVIGGLNLYNGAMSLVNTGLISSQTSGQSILIQANSFANSTGGTLQASNGGILTITPGNPWTNTGTIAVGTGSTVNLGGTFDASGAGGIGTFNNTGGTINVNGTINNAGRTLTLNSGTGSWTMNGGTLSGGTLAFANGTNLMFANVASNLLTGVTVNGDLTLSATGGRTQIAGGTTFVTAHLANTSAGLGFAPGQTLTGTISFEGASASGRYVDMNGTAGTLTIGSTGVVTTAAGFAGSAVIGGTNDYNGAMSLVNTGLISSQTSGLSISIQASNFANSTGGTLQASNGGILTITPGNPWTNTGTIAVSTGSTVNLGGTLDATGAGGIGTFNNTGGTVNVIGTLNNTGRTLTLNSSTGSWTMNGGTLSGGTLAFANGTNLMFANVASNLLTGVTVNGDLTLSATGGRTQIAGGTTFATAHLSNTSTGLGFAPGQTLTGTISFEGASTSGRYVDMNGAAGTLTIGSTGVITTAAGFAGSAVIGGQSDYNGAMSLVNTGLISSQTSGLTISIQANNFANSTGGILQATNGGILTIAPGNPWTNTGTIAVSTGSTINLGGTFDATGAGGIGTFNNTGGTINVNGTINNTGRTLTLNSSTGSWTMNGGTLSGGTLAYANGANLLFANVSSNLLTGVTVNGDLTLSAVGARTQIGGGTTFVTAHLANTSATLGFAPGQTLTGTVSFEGASANGRFVDMNGIAGTLTIGSTGVITTAAGFAGSAVIGGINSYGGAMSLVNKGLISSQTSGLTISIQANNFANSTGGILQASNGGILTIAPPAANPWTNTGTIAVSTGGIVNLGGTFDASGAGGIGAFNNTGGTINVNGTINNTGRTLTLNSSTGSWTLLGGTVSGGAVAFANGANLLIGNVASNLLTGVTVNGDLTLSAANSVTQIAGGTTFATAHLANTSATLGFANGQTLTGTISFEGASGNGRFVDMNGAAGTFTVGSTGVITTAAGFAGSAVIGGVNIFNGAMTLINNGLISSQTSGRTVTINAATFTDNGTLEAINGGILTVTAGYTQTGATSVTRLNNGTITVGTGKTITIASGRLEGPGTITGNVTNMGTLSPTLAAAPAAGILRISGDLTLATSSNVQIALGGLTQGTGYDEITEAGTTQLVLGGVLSISLINGFTATSAAETFTIIASNVAIAGMFSNVVSGRVTSVDGSEQFLVNVVGNNVVLTPAITPITEVRVTTGSKPTAVALDPVTNQVYVANLGDGVNPSTVTVIDGATNNPATVNAGVAPTAIALNPVTNQVYVVNRGDGTHASIVTVIDGASRATTPVTVGVGAQAVALNPVTNKTYVTNRAANTVTVIDGANRSTTTVSAGTNPSALAVNPTTNKIYVANTGSGTVTVLNGATGGTAATFAATVNVGSNPVAVAVNALTNKIYVANGGDGTNPSTVTVIDGATNVPTSIAAGVSPTALAVNPATNKIYVVNFGSDTITVIDGGTLTTATVPVQFSPNAIAVDAATNLIYLTNSVSGTLTSIDGQTNATTNFLVGTSPSALAINPLTNRIYVLDQASNDVVVKDGSINNTATVPVGTNPLAMAVNPITNATYVVNGGSNPQLPGTVTLINGFGNTTASVAVGKQPVAIALNPVTNLAYVANQADGTVSVIDGSSNSVTTLTIGGTPSAVTVNPVNNEIYVIDSLNSVVAVIDGISHSISSVAVVTSPKAIAVNPATNQVLVVGGSGASGSLTIIDGTTLTTTSVAVGAGPKSVAVNPVTNQIYVANSQAATVTVIDGTTHATATVSAGAGAAFVAVNSVTNLIYVANATANTVTVIDGATNATASVTVGSAPAFLAVNPVSNLIYVTNGGDGTVTVIDGPSNLTAPITAGTTPGPAAVNPATSKLYVANQGSGSVTVVTPAVSAQSNLTTFIASLPGNEVFSNSATLDLSAGSLSDPPPPGQQIYYQLDTASGPWLPAVASGPNDTAALTGLLPGLHTLYTFAADALQTASIDASASAGPIASQIAAYTFLASPGGTFTFQNSSVLIHNTDSMVMVTVVRDFDAPASVHYRAVSGTAVEGTNFAPTQGTLYFTQGQNSQTITVPIISQDLGEAQAFFSVELSSPSTSSFIGTPGSIGVFMLNDSTADLALSSLAFVAPATAPGAGGSITVSLTPPAANGQWRLLGELAWRNSGDTVSGLISADYVVEFKQVSGYQAPDLLVVTVLAGANAPASGPYMASAAQPAGSLSVTLAPPGTGGWRLQGESAFRAGGSTATALNAGSYIVEFQPVAGLSTPANSEVNVQAGQLNTFSTTYLIGDSPTGVVPALEDGFTSGDKRILPATSYTGQIQTDNGFGTGFVPMDRVVVTAAHVLFDDGSLTYVSGIRWFFQHDTGSFEAPPQIPRGFYVLDGYASQRAVDNSPGISSTTSQGLDAAAMYFLEPAARGGASGYLASSSAANAWLTNSSGAILRDKFIAGYPVGTVDPATIGRLYATPLVTDAFQFVTGSLFKTQALTSYPGNSGGPLFVGYNDPLQGETFYPAAIYLGGTAQTVVRAIDGQVIDLMSRAEVSGNGGANNVGGGVLQVNAGLSGSTAFALASVNVALLPSGVARAGARWGLNSAPNRQSGEAILNLPPGTYTIRFSSVTGYTTPAPIQMTVRAGQALNATGSYALNRPVITSRNVATAIAGQPFRFQVTATPSPTSFSGSGLPDGLTLDPMSGLISGITFQANPVTVSLQATNAAGQGTASDLQLTVAMAGQLNVAVTGSGSVTKALANSTVQAVGSNLTILATPAAGYLFENWSSTDPDTGVTQVIWHHPSYAFEMPTILNLQANFIKNPFPLLIGAYNGLLRPPAGVSDPDTLAARGSVTLSVTSLGGFTGSLYVGKQKYTLRGTFDATGAYAGIVAGARGQPSLVLNLQLDTTGATQQVTGSASLGGVTLALAAYRASFTAASPAPQALGLKAGARYTMALPHATTAGAPGGDGFGTVTVSPAGAVRFIGTLGDGTAITQGTSLGKNGQWPFFMLLYGQGGALTGLLNIPAPPSSTVIGGSLDWFAPKLPKALVYPNGFTTSVSVQGAVLNATPLTGLSQGTLTITGGALNPAVAPIGLTIDSKGNVTGTGLSLFKIVPTTGLFSGQFQSGAQKVLFRGALLPAAGAIPASGFGFFKGNTQQTGAAEF